MCDQSKTFLYAWCGKRKITPNYVISQSGSNQKMRFKCEVQISGYNYTGLGNSTNKRDAALNAARDFIMFLVRNGEINQNELPFNSPQQTGSTSEPQILPQIEPHLNPQQSSQQRFVPEMSGYGNQQRYGQMPYSSGPKQEYIDNIAQKRKFEEAEELDVNSGIHGNWTLDNAKQQLHQYLQVNKMIADYKYTAVGPDHNRSFVCELDLYIRQLGRNVRARELGSNKQLASRACALSMMRQFYHFGVIGEFQMVSSSKKKAANLIDSYEIEIPQHFLGMIEKTLSDFNTKPIPIQEHRNAEGLLETYSILMESPSLPNSDSIVSTQSCVSWCPPIENWNPWKGCNIDEGPLAFSNLPQISETLIRNKRDRESDPKLREMIDRRKELPIWETKDHILNTIKNNRVVIIRGSTGCGKTTQVPQFILDSYIDNNRGAECNIIVTQPRRISAISISERVAQERGEVLNPECSVGYSVRFENALPRPYGSILFCTVGNLLRKLEAGLRGISHIIIDEVHERDVNTDFILVIVRDMANAFPDMKVLLMSATIDTSIFQQYFGNAPILEIPGQAFPVQEYFLEDCIEMLKFIPPPYHKKRRDEDSEAAVDGSDDNMNRAPLPPNYSDATRRALAEINERETSFEMIESLLGHIQTMSLNGSVLIFLPGWNLIFALMKYLQQHRVFGSQMFRILPLHSQIPREEQRKVFEPVPKSVTKIILATNIAETSITIDDVVFVIDSCKVKIKLFTSHNNMTNYATDWASKTNLQQRKGRAGRVRPGFCFYLCSRARFNKLEEYIKPEIFRTPLHEISLTIKLLRLGAIAEFLSKAIEPPPIHIVIESEVILRELRALDDRSELTPLGRILARLPIEPRMGKMLITAVIFGCADTMATITANSSTCPDPFEMYSIKKLSWVHRKFGQERFSDHMTTLNAFNKWEHIMMRFGESAAYDFCEQHAIMPTVMKITSEAKKQLLDLLKGSMFPEESLTEPFYSQNTCEENNPLDVVTGLLVLGLYPNVCIHKDKRKVLTTEGKIAIIHKSSINFTNMPQSFFSPFFIFGEKLRTNVVSAKQMSMITPIHLMIFGAKKVEVTPDLYIQLDKWIDLRMDPNMAAAIVALRPLVEDLIMRVSANPQIPTSPQELQLINTIKTLCDFNCVQIQKTPPRIADQNEIIETNDSKPSNNGNKK